VGGADRIRSAVIGQEAYVRIDIARAAPPDACRAVAGGLVFV
jgi:hypothetical protein